MRFTVWAPEAKTVELSLNGGRHSMTRDDEGNWSVEVAPPEAGGARYQYILDDGDPLPDPRSRWQPEGVHGPSETVDAAALRAVAAAVPFKQKPLEEAVIYELHVGTFSSEGTYAGAAARLPHLASLGVTHVELMPLATFPGEHGWGYDGVFLFAPHPAYGTPLELAEFVRACHGHGLAVILDVVYNHLGPDGNYLDRYGPYFTDRWKTPWGRAVNFDGPDSDGARRFVIDNALMWLRDYQFDGLRLDAVHAIFDTRATHILEELADAVADLEKAEGRPLVLIAESDLNDPRVVLPPELGGCGLHAHWADDFHHAAHVLFTGERDGYYRDFRGFADLPKILESGYLFQGDYSQSRRRRHGRPPRGVKPHQLVVCLQNHDQSGNRAAGERLSMLVEPPRLKAAAALLLLSPFTPMLFQGEEWGARTPFLFFTDHRNPEIAEATREGRREEFKAFGWKSEDVPDPQDAETFRRSVLRWDELQRPEHADLLAWYRTLVHLRREARGAAGDAAVESAAAFDEEERRLTLRRGNVLAVFNFGERERVAPLPDGKWRAVLATGDFPEEARGSVPAPAGSVAVFVLQDGK